jgi:hypothetical protein
MVCVFEATASAVGLTAILPATGAKARIVATIATGKAIPKNVKIRLMRRMVPGRNYIRFLHATRIDS